MFKKIRSYINVNNGVLVVALLISMSWVWGTVQALQRNFELQLEVDRLAQEVALIDLQNDTLRFQQNYYNTDEYLELSARERLNKAAAGEKVLILPTRPSVAQPTPATAGSLPKEVPITERSNFEQWMYFLFSQKE